MSTHAPRSTSTTETGGPDAGAALADVWQRVVARLVDHVLVGIALAVLLSALGLGAFSVMGGPGRLVAGVVAAVVTAAVSVGYFTVLEARDGRTLGKRLLGIRVVDAAGRTPGIEQALRRNLWTGLGIVSAVPLVGGAAGTLASFVAVVLILVTMTQDARDRRGWHDTFAGGTRVVRAD